VIGGGAVAAEDVIGDDAALVHGDVGEQGDPGDIPSAHRPSPARHRSSTGIAPRASGVRPAVSGPSPAVAGRRPTPRMTRSVPTSVPSSRVTIAPSAPRRARAAVRPVWTVTPSADSASCDG
jgi:hypothetical protein